MANYTTSARTNYFRVTDEKKYIELFNRLVADDSIEDFTRESSGILYHGFGSYSTIDYLVETDSKDDICFDNFLEELQKILPDDEAFIYVESGNEKLRVINGFAYVVTSSKIEFVDLISWTLSTVKELLGDNNNVNFCCY